MITLALTGSIGMGKSTVAAMFRDAGIPVFDADATVRMLQGEGGRLVPAIERRFPGTTRDGKVDRDALSAAVLGETPSAVETAKVPSAGTPPRRTPDSWLAADAKRWPMEARPSRNWCAKTRT